MFVAAGADDAEPLQLLLEPHAGRRRPRHAVADGAVGITDAKDLRRLGVEAAAHLQVAHGFHFIAKGLVIKVENMLEQNVVSQSSFKRRKRSGVRSGVVSAIAMVLASTNSFSACALLQSRISSRITIREAIRYRRHGCGRDHSKSFVSAENELED
jgi:hypothetical protein